MLEFDGTPPSPPTAPSRRSILFASFGEYARTVLGISSPPALVHVAWHVKTPIIVAPLPFNHSQEAMAFRFVDPTPFLPHGAQRVMVPGRPLMKRLVTGKVHRQNNDLAIVTFNPLPQHQLDFEVIRDAVNDFLNQNHIQYETIQPCPFGQAYVKFTYLHQRDLLIHNSPMHYGNGTVSFIPHDRAWNNRTAVVTHDVWMSLIGLNVDLWTHALVDKAVSDFGKLIAWEEDLNNMARVYVRARVCGLDSIPWFFTFTKGLDPTSDSWTVRCEIFQATLLGGLPQDEDFHPGPDNGDDGFHPNHFDFYGYGQPGHGPQGPPLHRMHLSSLLMLLRHRSTISRPWAGMFGPITRIS